MLISSPKRGHMISCLDGLLSVGSTGGRDYDRRESFVTEETDTRPTDSAKLELLRRAVDVLPELEGAKLVHHLAGSRPMAPLTLRRLSGRSQAGMVLCWLQVIPPRVFTWAPSQDE